MKKWLNLLSVILIIFSTILILNGCMAQHADYTPQKAEQLLAEGKSIDGKTVAVTANNIVPISNFGYNIESGKNLNFISEENPHLNKGQKTVLKVKKVNKTLGAYMITYSKIKE